MSDVAGHGGWGRLQGREGVPGLFVALDLPDLGEAGDLARRLAPLGVRFKVGLELFCRVGPQGIARLQEETGPVLLDLKLHDIPRTVERAVAAVAGLGAWGVTLHATGGPVMLRAAVSAARAAGAEQPLRCLAVTVLTSLDEQLLHALGVRSPLREQVGRLAGLAVAAGCDGVVASPQEAPLIRELCPPSFLVVTPGVRPLGSDPGDQARTATPAAAVAAGVDHVVIGRPVSAAADPVAAAAAVLREMEQAAAVP